MTAELLEALNQAVAGKPVYLSGRTAKELPGPVFMTTDRQALEDDALYCFSEIGIWKVD